MSKLRPGQRLMSESKSVSRLMLSPELYESQCQNQETKIKVVKTVNLVGD